MRLFDQRQCRYLTPAEEKKLYDNAPRAVAHFTKQPTPMQIKRMNENENKTADKGVNTDCSYLMGERKDNENTCG